jgi:hypothetical protein
VKNKNFNSALMSNTSSLFSEKKYLFYITQKLNLDFKKKMF